MNNLLNEYRIKLKEYMVFLVLLKKDLFKTKNSEFQVQEHIQAIKKSDKIKFIKNKI